MKQSTIWIGFVDFLFALMIVGYLMIGATVAQDSASRSPAKYTLWVTWDTGLDIDVDVWIKLPDGTTVSYGRKDVGYVTIERDDLGTITNNGQTNLEVVNFREVKDGEYGISLHTYSARSPIQGSITVELSDAKGVTLFSRAVPMPAVGHQAGVAVFSIAGEQISSIRNSELTFRGK